jgi:alkylation response protein AidB-like acyl-CoA dehydrogenase/predicted heme/steroid binding protein
MPAKEKVLKSMTREEVAQANSFDDKFWIIIDGKVYDITKFGKLHPGGYSIFLDYAGKDATDQFFSFHKREVLEQYFPKLCIGEVEAPKIWDPKREVVIGNDFTKVDPALEAMTEEEVLDQPLVSKAPFGECTQLRKHYTNPYYKKSHLQFRMACRKFFATLKPDAEECEDTGDCPEKETFQYMGQQGILAAKVGVLGMKYAKKFGIPLPGGVKHEEFDFFHELIAHEEMTRLGTPGYVDGLGAGYSIGLPPIINFYYGPGREEIIKEIMTGEKTVVLAISEPHVGSDVASMNTTATPTPDGKHYIIRGIKKWITNGTFADYFVTAARTGGKGLKGISLFLVKRDENLKTTKIKTAYSPAAGTGLCMYEDIKVPATALMGELNKGFQCIMLNFNHERWMIAACAMGSLRLVLGESFLWLNQRKAFGKTLLDQPVLRYKLGQMVANVEALQAMMEDTTRNMQEYYQKVAADKKWLFIDYLAGQIALLKYQTTRTCELVADNGCQLFGGRAVTRTGMGKYIERFHRSKKIVAIYGGSEEIMADLGVRQAVRDWTYKGAAKL